MLGEFDSCRLTRIQRQVRRWRLWYPRRGFRIRHCVTARPYHSVNWCNQASLALWPKPHWASFVLSPTGACRNWIEVGSTDQMFPCLASWWYCPWPFEATVFMALLCSCQGTGIPACLETPFYNALRNTIPFVMQLGIMEYSSWLFKTPNKLS